MCPKWKMSLGVTNEFSQFHDNLPIRFPVYMRKVLVVLEERSGSPPKHWGHMGVILWETIIDKILHT